MTTTIPAEVRVGDQTFITITIKDEDGSPVDISGAGSIILNIRKPDGSILEREPTLVSDGTDGKVYYQVQSGEFDSSGLWKFQVILQLESGQRSSTIVPLDVHRNLV